MMSSKHFIFLFNLFLSEATLARVSLWNVMRLLRMASQLSLPLIVLGLPAFPEHHLAGRRRLPKDVRALALVRPSVQECKETEINAAAAHLRGGRPGLPDDDCFAKQGLSTRMPECWRQRLTVYVVAFALFNDMVQITMLTPIVPLLIASPPPLGVTVNAEMAMGLLYASKDIFQLVSAPLAGYLTAQYSSQSALWLSTFGLGVATLCFAEASTFPSLLFARSCQGAASAAMMSGGLSLIAETHPGEKRGAAMGMVFTGLAVGVLCGPLIGGLLFDKLGRKQTFRLAGCVVLLNAFGQLLLMLGAPSDWAGRAGEADKKKQGSTGYLKILSNYDVLAVTAASVAINSVLGVLKPISQIILDREFSMKIVARSLVISIATVTYLISTPVAGWLSDHIPRAKLVSGSLCLMAMATMLIALRHTGLWAVYVCCGMVGTSCALNGAVAQALLADIVDRHKLGSYGMVYALSDMADSLGFILGPTIGLTVSQYSGPSAAAGMLGMACLLLAPTLFRLPG